MGNGEAGQAVRDHDNLRADALNDVFENGDPLLTSRVVPVALRDADDFRVGLLPERLPMLRPGVSDTGEGEYGWWHQ